MNKASHILLIMVIALATSFASQAQETDIQVNTDWDHERHSWEADWITHPTASVLDYGVFLFRNEFRIERAPESMMVHLSADNRYKLWVNGKMVTTGPAKGSFLYWRYESIDLGPWLVEGDNVLAVEVHQNPGGLADLSFDLELGAATTSLWRKEPYLIYLLPGDTQPGYTACPAGPLQHRRLLRFPR